MGNRQWVDVLPWAGAARWAAAQEEAWEVGGQQAGTVTAVDGLSFVKVSQAGHMVRALLCFCSSTLQRSSGAGLHACMPAQPAAARCLRQQLAASPQPGPPDLPIAPSSPRATPRPTHRRLRQVPMDQPRNALAMITRFTRAQKLSDSTADAADAASAGAAGAQRQLAKPLLPGATWRLRRALPAGDATLTAAAEA